VPHRISEAARAIPYSLRYAVNAYPSLYGPVVRLRHRDEPSWVVDARTDLVIEGMGRSGNTFAVDAFVSAQPRPVRIVHHTHSAALVMKAARSGVPVLLLVREPSEVVVSQMILRGVPPRPPLNAWIRFHRRLLPFRDRIVVASFAQATSDLGAVIERVNDRFGTGFVPFEHSDENVRRVFDAIDDRNRTRFGGRGDDRWVAKPSPEREGRKARLSARYEAPSLAARRATAAALYESFLATVPA
jgi:hypothetical protein